MSYPDTSTEDLRRMGITPQAIRNEMERTGNRIEGDIVGYFLPGDNYNGNPQNRRARNMVKSDWHPIFNNPPEIIKEEEYNQSFQNFDGDSEIEFAFSHSVQVVTAEDYTQTQRFEISVNAEIPLGQSGAMVGFNASMSAQEVKQKSKSETVNRVISFPLTVPAGEGRTVAQKTVVKAASTLYEASLRAQGSVGIEVNPGIFKPNHYWWYYNIENIFPSAESASRIIRSSTNTDVLTKVLKIPNPGHEGEEEVVEYRFFSSDVTPAEPETICMAIAPASKKGPTGPSPFFASMKITVQFAGVLPEVPLGKRQDIIDKLRVLILANIHSIGNPSDVTYGPGSASASFSIGYSPKDITEEQFEAAVIKQTYSIQWGGQYAISFA